MLFESCEAELDSIESICECRITAVCQLSCLQLLVAFFERGSMAQSDTKRCIMICVWNRTVRCYFLDGAHMYISDTEGRLGLLLGTACRHPVDAL